MRLDTELIVKSGSSTIYVSGIFGVNPSLNKIYVGDSATPWLGPDFYEMLGSQPSIINVYGDGDVLLDTVIITSAAVASTSGTLEYAADNPALIADGVYFTYNSGNEKLYVLDLYDNESISQSWRFNDIKDFSISGSFTRQFRIPATANNIEILGILYDVNYAADDVYFNKKLPAELKVSHLPIGTGYIRVMKVYRQLDSLTDIEITFYAELPDLVKAIGTKKLKDLTDLPNLNHVLDYNGVVAATGYPYLYTLTDYGQKWSEAGEVGARRVMGTTPDTAVKAGDLTPAVNWSYIFQQIIADAGFTVEAPEMLDILDKYYTPWLSGSSIKAEYTEQDYYFKFHVTNNYNNTTGYPLPIIGGITVDYDVTGSVVDGGVYGMVYTAPATGYYYFRHWGKRSTTPNGNTLQYGLTLFNITTLSIVTDLYNGPVLPSIVQTDSGTSIPPVFLTAGTQYAFFISGYLGQTTTIYAGADYNNGTGVELYNIDIVDGSIIDYSKNAPDVTQIDFIRDVLNMHCCAVIPDKMQSNKVRIVPLKDYLYTGNMLDWEKKLDISKDIVIYGTADMQNKKLSWSYKAGEEYYSKLYKDAGRIYGDYKVDGYTVTEDTPPNDFAREGETKVQLVCESTPANYIKDTDIIIPKFINNNGEYVAPNLRCLYHADDKEISLYDYQTDTVDTAYVVPILNHYDKTNPSFSDNDLNWSPEVPLHLITANPINNLFNVYWRDYINALYAPDVRILEAYFSLDIVDLATFTFADVVRVKESNWRILDISDYKVGEYDTTKVTLIKVAAKVPETSATPIGIATDGSGVVDFVDGAGNPVSATRSACERYGYYYNSVTGTCQSRSGILPKAESATVSTKVGATRNETKSAQYSLNMADGIDVDSTNIYGVNVGTEITREKYNPFTLAVGDTLKQTEDSAASQLLGTNVLSTFTGMHIGAGWLHADKSASADGAIQCGEILLANASSFNTAGVVLELLGNLSANDRLKLPDSTAWLVTMHMVAVKSDYADHVYGLYTFILGKKGSLAVSSAVNTVYAYSSTGLTLTVTIDDTTDSTQHRIKVTSGGSGFPHGGYQITARLSYTQVR